MDFQITRFAHANRRGDFVHISKNLRRLKRDQEAGPIYMLCFRKSRNDELAAAWGWQDTGSDKIVMIMSTYSGFKINFPDGPQAEVESGKGQIVPLFLVRSILISEK